MVRDTENSFDRQEDTEAGMRSTVTDREGSRIIINFGLYYAYYLLIASTAFSPFYRSYVVYVVHSTTDAETMMRKN